MPAITIKNQHNELMQIILKLKIIEIVFEIMYPTRVLTLLIYS